MIRTLVIIFVLLLVLSFFGVSIRALLESPTGKDNITFLSELIHTGFRVLENYFLIMVNNLKEIGNLVGTN